MLTESEVIKALDNRIILIESKIASSNPTFKTSYSITQLLDGLKQIIAKFPEIEPFLVAMKTMNMVHELPASRDYIQIESGGDGLMLDEKRLVITSSLSDLNNFVLQFDELISQLDSFEKLYDATKKFQNNNDSTVIGKFESIRSKFNLQLVRTIKLLEKQMLSAYEEQCYYIEAFEKLRQLQE